QGRRRGAQGAGGQQLQGQDHQGPAGWQGGPGSRDVALWPPTGGHRGDPAGIHRSGRQQTGSGRLVRPPGSHELPPLPATMSRDDERTKRRTTDEMTAQARLLGGRYQVGELLGYGGMAEVHRGRDLRLGRDVAIKTLRTDLARDATFQLRFRREAQNAAALNHPAIVAVYDTGEEHGPSGEELPYIVMEFVNGRTLKEVLTAEGRLIPRRALEIVAAICSALEFSHRPGTLHRDIKPGNVMLTQTGQVKVMDFGIARALATGASTMTQTAAVIGTAQYLSPEQARGEAVDARSDVYATGCVIYELLCGQPPFVGDNP